MPAKRSFFSVRALFFAFVFLQLTAAALAAGPSESIVHFFNGSTGGNGPNAGLVADTVGNLYGVTANGGTSSACQGGCGTVSDNR